MSLCPPTDTPKDTRVSLSPSSGNIGVGDTVTLSCQVGSSHPPVSGYHWYKDGVAVGTQQELALRGVRREDHGRYHCEAQNALGTGVSPAVTLHVFCECHRRGRDTAECLKLGWHGLGIGVAVREESGGPVVPHLCPLSL